jgi:hypothetical protein
MTVIPMEMRDFQYWHHLKAREKQYDAAGNAGQLIRKYKRWHLEDCRARETTNAHIPQASGSCA